LYFSASKKSEQDCINTLNALLSAAFSQIFIENTDCPFFLLDGTISDDLAQLLQAIESDLQLFRFSSVVEFESFIDTLLVTVQQSILDLLKIKQS
jgi:hypothetical protein